MSAAGWKLFDRGALLLLLLAMPAACLWMAVIHADEGTFADYWTYSWREWKKGWSQT